VRIVLVSTYELGRQPFGLASPAAWLRGEGHSVTCADLSRGPLPRSAIEAAELIAFFRHASLPERGGAGSCVESGR
jgi:hypothetical protein